MFAVVGHRENRTKDHKDHTPAIKLAREDHQEKEDKTKSEAEEEMKESGSGGQSQKLADPGQTHTPP